MASPTNVIYNSLSAAMIYAGLLSPGGGTPGGGTPGGGGTPQSPANLTTLKVNSPSTVAAAPFYAGLSFKDGDVNSADGIVIAGATSYQTHVKKRYPSGCVALAMLAAIMPLTANTDATLTVGRGTAPTSGTSITTAQLKASNLAVTLASGANGSAVFAAGSADWDAPVPMVPGEDSWVSGPVMSMWRYRKQLGSHPNLALLLQVALFSNGEIRVFPVLENTPFMSGTSATVTDTFTLTINGVQRFSQQITMTYQGRTPLIGSSSARGGAELAYWVGTERRVRTKQERFYWQETKRIPTIYTELQFGTWTGDTTDTYQPLQQAQYRGNMSDGGSSGSIGTLPRWQVAHIVSDDPVAFESMIRQEYSHGRYGVYYRDETTKRPIVVTDYPNHQVAVDLGAPRPHVDPFASAGVSAFTYTPVPTGTAPPQHEQAHHPAPGWVPYIATCDPYFLEDIQFTATCHYLQLGYGRYGSRGILLNWLMQRRQHAWTTRTLAMAVAASPEACPVGAALAYNLDENIKFYNDRRNAKFGILPQGNGTMLRSDGDTRDMDRNQPFMHDFYVSALGFSLALQLGTTASMRTMMQENFLFAAKGTVMRFGGTGTDEWPVCDAAGSPQGWMTTSGTQGDPNSIASVFGNTPDDSFDIISGAGNFFANAGENYRYWQRQMVIETRAAQDANSGHTGPKAVDPGPVSNPTSALPLRGGYWPTATALWGNAMLAIGYCVQHGAAGAQAAWDRFTQSSNWHEIIDNAIATKAPEYMYAPSAALVQPGTSTGTVTAPPAGTRVNITRNNASSVDPDGGSANGSGKWYNSYYNSGLFASVSGAWNGGCFAPEYGTAGAIILFGGGHGSSVAMVAFIFDIGTGIWSCVGFQQSVPPNGDWTGISVWSPNDGGASYVKANDQRNTQYMDYPYVTAAGTSYITLAAHMYFNTQYDPTVGAKGSLIIGVNQSFNDPNTDPVSSFNSPELREAYLWHRLDLATGLISRGTGSAKSLQGNKNDNAMIRDTKRGRWLRIRQQNATVEYQDAADAHPRPVKTMTATWEGGNPVGTFGVRNHSPLYVEELDATFIFSSNQQFNGTVNAQVIDHKTGGMVGAAVTIPPRNFPYGGQSVGVAYVPRLNAFYFYEGRQSTTCEVLQLSTTDPRTSTYTWRRESFTGPTPPGTDPASLGEFALTEELHAAWRKWAYSKQLDCLIWANGISPADTCQDGQQHDGVVQAWRPPGTVVG